GYTLDLLQTDASINSGNSGGPLINSFGEVIGVTNAKISTGEGLGFAIPISDVADEIQSIINYGYVANRPYLGITVGNVASDAYYGAVEGVYVAEVDPGSPAEEAGMQEGDMIISMDGVAIEMTDDIIDVRNQHVPGDEIEVVVERNGRQIELNLVIGDSNDAE
ncbi:MAG: PDZ domain-containing protein, partial [Clostridiales bacterium]|nr:PDZ domain-containing protein [Clostridiales bacterium]